MGQVKNCPPVCSSPVTGPYNISQPSEDKSIQRYKRFRRAAFSSGLLPLFFLFFFSPSLGLGFGLPSDRSTMASEGDDLSFSSTIEREEKGEIMTITLRSLGGDKLVLPLEKAEEVAKESLFIWEALLKRGQENDTELPVGVRTLEKAIDYGSEHGKEKKFSFGHFMDENGNYIPEIINPDDHKANKAVDENLWKWDADFLVACSTETILELVTAADHLWMPGLKDLACQAAMDKMIGKGREGIKDMFYTKFEKNLQEADQENALMLDIPVLKDSKLEDLQDVIKFLGPLPFEAFNTYRN